MWIAAGRIPGTLTDQAVPPLEDFSVLLKKKNQDKIHFQVFSQKTNAVPGHAAMGVKSPSPLLPEKSGSRKSQEQRAQP